MYGTGLSLDSLNKGIREIKEKLKEFNVNDKADSGLVTIEQPRQEIRDIDTKEIIKEIVTDDKLFLVLMEDIKELRQRLGNIENKKSFADKIIGYFKKSTIT